MNTLYKNNEVMKEADTIIGDILNTYPAGTRGHKWGLILDKLVNNTPNYDGMIADLKPIFNEGTGSEQEIIDRLNYGSLTFNEYCELVDELVGKVEDDLEDNLDFALEMA